jgi:hypothetical protein
MRLDVCSSAAVGSIDMVDRKCKESQLMRVPCPDMSETELRHLVAQRGHTRGLGMCRRQAWSVETGECFAWSPFDIGGKYSLEPQTNAVLMVRFVAA